MSIRTLGAAGLTGRLHRVHGDDVDDTDDSPEDYDRQQPQTTGVVARSNGMTEPQLAALLRRRPDLAPPPKRPVGPILSHEQSEAHMALTRAELESVLSRIDDARDNEDYSAGRDAVHCLGVQKDLSDCVREILSLWQAWSFSALPTREVRAWVVRFAHRASQLATGLLEVPAVGRDALVRACDRLTGVGTAPKWSDPAMGASLLAVYLALEDVVRAVACAGEADSSPERGSAPVRPSPTPPELLAPRERLIAEQSKGAPPSDATLLRWEREKADFVDENGVHVGLGTKGGQPSPTQKWFAWLVLEQMAPGSVVAPPLGRTNRHKVQKAVREFLGPEVTLVRGAVHGCRLRFDEATTKRVRGWFRTE